MCRLFGLMANKEVDIVFSFLKTNRSFKKLGSLNRDGWGLGYYKNDNPQIFKEPVSTEESLYFNNIVETTYSNIIISHVRLSTQGIRTRENTHPFVYRNWIFAHNGNIDIKSQIKEQLLQKYAEKIMGETDSEVFFLFLIQFIEQNNNVIEGIKEAIKFIENNKGIKTTSLNFLLTNGKKIYALRKAFEKINYYSLFYLNRDPKKANELKYTSEQTRLFIHSKRLSNERAIIICSEQLTSNEEWIPFSNGDLIIVDDTLKISNEKV